MKILICCPGSWTHGLDSPERGEGRWSQNLARLLGKSGQHTVVAASAGNPSNGNGRPCPGVKLVRQQEARQYGPFDFYFDSSWWEGKSPVAEAKHYFHVAWSLETRFRNPNFPKNHYIIYPYSTSQKKFIGDFNPNKDRTFFLPTPFCEKLAEPSFDNKELLWPARPGGTPYRDRNVRLTLKALEEIRSDFSGLKMNWMFKDDLLDKKFIKNDQYKGDSFVGLSPYFEIVKLIKKSKLSIPVNTPACVPDCSVEGVPSLIWQREGWDFLQEVAVQHGMLIEKDPSKERIKEVIVSLLTDREKYTSFAKGLQHCFRFHSEPEVLKCFDFIVGKVV